MTKKDKNILMVKLKVMYGDDLEEIFGDDLKTMLENVRKNYIDDDKTEWDKVDCIQSLDFMLAIVNGVLEMLK